MAPGQVLEAPPEAAVSMEDAKDRRGAAAPGGDEAEVQAIPSLCMACGEEGLTRLMFTVVPHFRELVLMAFECPHCNERNNEVQFAGQLQPRGCRLSLTVPEGNPEVLNRQVVKSDSATLLIPELEFEVPPESQRGSLSTVEGMLSRAASDLRLLQDERKRVNPEMAEALDVFLEKLEACAHGASTFTVVLDDPAGNSFIQNPHAPEADPLLTSIHYERTPGQNEAMGYLAGPEATGAQAGGQSGNSTSFPSSLEELPGHTSNVRIGAPALVAAKQSIAEASGEHADALLKYTAPEEVMIFPGHCGACGVAVEQRMFVTNIPYFKEVILMACACDVCGWRSSELKGGGSVPLKGRRMTLRVKTKRDLSRDVIKSDTASVVIPEVELELTAGTLGGRVTTVEGLVCDIRDSLQRVQSFNIGDSATASDRVTWHAFQKRLSVLLELEEEWTIILDDAMANSFIAPMTESPKDDLQLVSEEYERTWEQDEELGLHDINTEAPSETAGLQ